MSTCRPHIAIGPQYPGVGSWEWVGAEMGEELAQYFDISVFRDSIPVCDLALIVKYDFSRLMQSRHPTTPVVFLPIDCYGSGREIDRDGEWLFQCQRIILHANSLRKYFHAYAPVESVDHHVRFVGDPGARGSDAGPILWTGIRTNLPPLAEWVNRYGLPRDLWILTNLDGAESASAGTLGFRTGQVRVEAWSAEKHIAWASEAAAAIDIKSDDFRSRHKPPTKAFDSLASGLPLAMNGDSSPVERLAQMGFHVPAPNDVSRWFSDEYREETVRFGHSIREHCSREQVGLQFRRIIQDVLAETTTKTRLQPMTSASWRSSANAGRGEQRSTARKPRRQKIAVVSFLFNWPSTGGGNIHTQELVQFLGRGGYEVRHFFPRFDPWGIGRVKDSDPLPNSHCLTFQPQEWRGEIIRQRFCDVVRGFDPDCVLITDSWNFKPHLADAVGDYPYFLRMQALECLCPLNNLQLLADERGLRICPENQLVHPDACFSCLTRNTSGALHHAERQLSGVGSAEYDALLHRTIREAAGVLTLNPSIAAQYAPYSERVEVVTWGMDPDRFPWPPSETEPLPAESSTGRTKILFAGLVQEQIKGFGVLREACKRLWRDRQDFELLITGDPPPSPEPFASYIGWQSQEELPRWYRRADILAVPTIAPDGLSRTSVEAMASGTGVIASRIGGLPYSVSDGVNGLLCRPGDVADWENKLQRLLDNPDERRNLGLQGRRIFEERFTWETVIETDYRRLFDQVRSRQAVTGGQKRQLLAAAARSAE